MSKIGMPQWSIGVSANSSRRSIIFRIVGFIVVTGFALFGLQQFIELHVVNEKG